MDLSLAHLKKVLKFWIVLVGIQFAGLQSCLGEYTPSSLKDKKITWAYISNDNFAPLFWKTPLASCYGSEALAFQLIAPSAMLDSKGFFYALGEPSFSMGLGPWFCICKYDPQGKQIVDKNLYFYPWYMVNSTINCSETPDLSKIDGDQFMFKNYIHNAFQPCIAQEVGKYSDFLYVFCYVPPTRYMNPSNSTDDEGILMLKIKKESMSIDSQVFYSGHDQDNHFSFHHQRPRRDRDNHTFGPEFGNYQAWVDTDDSGTDHVHLNWIALEQANNFFTARVYQMYDGNVTNEDWSRSGLHACGRNLTSRAIKHNNYTYAANFGLYGMLTLSKYSSDSLKFHAGLSWNSGSTFGYIDHSPKNEFNEYTNRDYDFCIVDNVNEDSPIFCVLGLRSTSETDNSKIGLSGTNNERWKQNYFKAPSKIVLILSSYAWDGSTNAFVSDNKVNVIEDPQNIIYSTGKTTAESCTVDCDCYTNDKGDYEENQLFKNTHKLVAYTSESGTKYIIYCYCYPGKSKQLFLGYAPYIISNNKVQLLTKTEFKSPMGESFGDFTSCSKIISMDLKNGQLWITWMKADNKIYYYFHIAAKDLVGE